MKKVVLITGNEIRHEFFRKYLGACENIIILKTYCETSETSLLEEVSSQISASRQKHLNSRSQSEMDFFSVFCKKIKDNSNPKFIKKGLINSLEQINEIENLEPDLIVSYGCSIIKSTLLQTFKNRFVNLHLGISPYYRGSATNFFPFLHDEISCVGVTFMYIDEGIDTGKIIHQKRANISIDDSIHQIGNRLIADMMEDCEKLILNFDRLVDMKPLVPKSEKLFKKKDFTEESVSLMYQKFNEGIISNYLENKLSYDNNFPIVQNPALV